MHYAYTTQLQTNGNVALVWVSVMFKYELTRQYAYTTQLQTNGNVALVCVSVMFKYKLFICMC